MVNKFNYLWYDIDVFVYTLGSIAIGDVHATLSVVGLIISITYGVMKIKKDFFK